MAKTNQRKRNNLFSSSKKSRPKVRRDIQGTIVNSAIVVLSLLLIAFIFSFSNRQVQTGIPIEVTFPPQTDNTTLAVESYEKKPILDIEVEILNGCGVPGLAAKVSDYLRANQLDVVRSENADHYNYEKTLLILRNENFEGLQKVSDLFGINKQDTEHIKHFPDEQLSVDITIILGNDYQSIKPLLKYFQ